MDTPVAVPVAPAPVPAVVVVPAVPAAAPTMAQQILDSQAAPATPVAPAAAPVVKPDSVAPPASAPATDSALKDQLADAEKRLQDTQRWGHKNAEEASKLRAELTKIQAHPVLGKVLDAVNAPAPLATTAPTAADDAALKSAWADYQSSKTEEEAFTKLLKFAETRAASKAVADTQKVMTERENASRVQRQNQLTVQTINKTVSDTASDVPLELFWAMSGRAEAETPAEIKDYTERLQWQVGRAIDLSRAVLAPRVTQAATAGAQQAAIQAQAGAIMSAGGAAPAAAAAQTPAAPKTMAEYIKDMQRNAMAPRK